MSDIIVVGVSGMRRGGGMERKKERRRIYRQTRARRVESSSSSSVAHMHRDGDDDTIWSFAPEACDNITATCFMGDAMLGRNLLTPTRRERRTTDAPEWDARRLLLLLLTCRSGKGGQTERGRWFRGEGDEGGGG